MSQLETESSSATTIACAICLEEIIADQALCPRCGEPPSSTGPAFSIPPTTTTERSRFAWLRQHWRPTLTMSAIGSLITAGIALRYLAPDRYTPPRHFNPAAAAKAVCDSPCWHGESCQLGQCVWEGPNDVAHLPSQPTLAGPFDIPDDMVDVLMLDNERYAVSHTAGVQIANARTGGVLSLISDAPLAQDLFRVGTNVYAASPKRIYVIDAQSTRVLKTIEVGSRVGSIAVGASGWRALASLPGARSVVVLATDFHAEINRFYFGDDPVGPIAIDDTGERGLTTTGRVPIAGLAPPKTATHFGAMYAFNPSRFASDQDRVRASMSDNPVGLLMVPDSKSSFVLLRESNSLVAMQHLKSGAVRQETRLKTCRQPEQIALIRKGRRAIIRCNFGRAIEVFDIKSRSLLRHIPLNARVSDMALSPDGRQAVLALPHRGSGAVGLLDLDNYSIRLHQLNAEPHRIRLSPDGRTAIIISDRSKVAWVLR